MTPIESEERDPPSRATVAASTPADGAVRRSPRVRSGSLLADRYRLVERLGEGGIGVVWRAEDLRLGRQVALKLLREQRADSVDARFRIVREARAAAALEHPGINVVHDAGEDGNVFYIALGLVDGETVFERLGRSAIPPVEVVRIAGAVADALAYAHGRGLVHRDVSSRNVMLARDGRVLLLDFGVALLRDAARITRKGRVVGTPAYLSPEAARGAEADGRSDLYSLAVVTYEMLTGKLPYFAASADEMVYTVIHEPPVPPSHHRSDLPASVDAFFARALAKEPGRRFPSGTAFRDALQEAMRGPALSEASTTATTSTPAGPLRRTPLPEFLQIAVLPFRDDSGAAADAQAFARGLAEAASIALARYASVQVVPPAAVAASGVGEDEPLRLAREFGVNVVLTGSVRREGERLRVSYLALQPLLGVQLGAEHVDGTVGRLLDLEDDLARSLAHCLDLREPVGAPAPPRPIEEAEAREQFLQALGYLQRYDQEVMVDGAIGILERLEKRGAARADVYGALARAYLAKYRLTKVPEWAERAARTSERALALDPKSPAVLATLGQLRTQQGRYEEARRAYEAAIEQQPNLPDAVIGIAWAHAHGGNAAEAEALLQKAIELRPRHWVGYNYLGRFYFEHGRYAQATKCFRKVVELVPDSARGWTNLGGSYFQMDRLRDALAAYHRSIEYRVTATALTSLGTVHFYLGNFMEAVDVFERAVLLEPDNPMCWGNLGDGCRWASGLEARSQEAHERAMTLQRRLLQVNPDDPERWAWLAEWLAKRGRVAEAKSAIERALTLAPDNAACMCRAVCVYHQVGERASALAWLEKAIGHGQGRTEFARNPELADLRRDPTFARLLGTRKKTTTTMEGTLPSA
jgi:tetratricopeptide (TPR) repeat protein